MKTNQPDISPLPKLLRRKTIVACLVLFLISQVFFLVSIQYPMKYNFDEVTYIPAAKQFIHQETPEIRNWEHPPLAKELMAVGIKIFGDRPLGWRYMSTLFGSLTLVGMYLWGMVIFRNQSTAVFIALITLVNQLLYVHARIGILEVFMFAFMVFALTFFCAAWSEKVESRKSFSYCIGAGVMFGLAMACKWAAMVPWLSAILLIALIKTMQYWKTVFQGGPLQKALSKGYEDWYSPKLFGGMSSVKLAVLLILVPMGVYFLTFLPYLFFHKGDGTHYALLDLIPMQLTMWKGQVSIVTPHPYMSKWTSWPLMTRPICYAFDKEGEGFFRCVLFLGNPLIMWGGLLALLYCIWGWITYRSREAFLILSFYAAFYLGWAFIPRNISYYYYYYPAGMTLSMAIAFCFHSWETGKSFLLGRLQVLRWAFLTACILVFIIFYPILAAVKVSLAEYHMRMWFPSWI